MKDRQFDHLETGERPGPSALDADPGVAGDQQPASTSAPEMRNGETLNEKRKNDSEVFGLSARKR
jgi:hypothetical protein